MIQRVRLSATLRRRGLAAISSSATHSPLLSFEGNDLPELGGAFPRRMCSAGARPRFELWNGHPQLEHGVDTPDGARRGTAGAVEQVARNCSTTLAETRRMLQRASDGADQLICASDDLGRASQEAHLIQANAGFFDQAGQSMTTTGRSSSMNSNPIELWSVISASATTRYGDASGLSATCTRESRPSRCSRVRQSAPPNPARSARQIGRAASR